MGDNKPAGNRSPASSSAAGNNIFGIGNLKKNPLVFEPKREKYELELDRKVIRNIENLEEFLLENMPEDSKPNMSGWVESVLTYAMEANTDFQRWCTQHGKNLPARTNESKTSDGKNKNESGDGNNTAFDNVNKIGNKPSTVATVG